MCFKPSLFLPLLPVRPLDCRITRIMSDALAYATYVLHTFRTGAKLGLLMNILFERAA